MPQKCMYDKNLAILSNQFLTIPSGLFKRSKIKTLIVIKHTNHLVKKTMQYEKFDYYIEFVIVCTKEKT